MVEPYVVVAHGLNRENQRLQPWRYVVELATGFSRERAVIIVTDAPDGEFEERWGERLTVAHSRFLSFGAGAELVGLVNDRKPRRVWWSTTPTSVVYWAAWKRLRCPVTALVTCPLYPALLLIHALCQRVPFQDLKALLLQSLIPRSLFVRFLARPPVTHVVTMSRSNGEILRAAGLSGEKLRVIPVGMDAAERSPVSTTLVESARARLGLPQDGILFLYLGEITAIRGIDALLMAFRKAVNLTSAQIYLGVLARGADEHSCADLMLRAKELGIGDRVAVIGGWLSREEVWGNIEACDVVALPFIVVPSDVPIAVLEALARGRPVLASPIDGIPELVRDRGMLANPLDSSALAAAIVRLADDPELRAKMGRAAREFMVNYPSWREAERLASDVNWAT